MSEKLHESQPVLVPRDGGQIEVWKTTDIFDDQGRQFAESPDGLSAKPLSPRTLSPEGQAALAEELAMSSGRDPELFERGERAAEEPVVEAMGEDALELSGIESPDSTSDEAEPAAEQTPAQRLSKRLGGSIEDDMPPEAPEEKQERIKKYTLQSMGMLLEGVARHSSDVEHSGDPYGKRAFNEAMVSGMNDLKTRLDNELTTPEGAAMMSGLFVGATTDFDATVATFRTLEQSGRLPDKDIFELRQVLRDLEVIALNPQDVEFRHRIIGSLNERGDQLMFAKDANKRLGATYIGIATGVAVGGKNHGVIRDQYEGLMSRLSQL